MRGACSASPWACLLPRPMAPFIVQRRNCKRAAPTPFASRGPDPTERSGSARTGRSPVRRHPLPSLLARSPGGAGSYRRDPVLLSLLGRSIDVNERRAMPQPGDIVAERLTGNRAMVIRVLSPEEVTCRFGDGRFEARFTFELDRAPSQFGSLLSFVMSSFLSPSGPGGLGH